MLYTGLGDFTPDASNRGVFALEPGANNDPIGFVTSAILSEIRAVFIMRFLTVVFLVTGNLSLGKFLSCVRGLVAGVREADGSGHKLCNGLIVFPFAMQRNRSERQAVS